MYIESKKKGGVITPCHAPVLRIIGLKFQKLGKIELELSCKNRNRCRMDDTSTKNTA